MLPVVAACLGSDDLGRDSVWGQSFCSQDWRRNAEFGKQAGKGRFFNN